MLQPTVAKDCNIYPRLHVRGLESLNVHVGILDDADGRPFGAM